ncbi:MAG TPA: CocE/NonD family hydrolase [Gemmatimonadales bacterium]|nr:CocE/NonD family hydrolase [Gemmatimonadales bacterium]
MRFSQLALLLLALVPARAAAQSLALSDYTCRFEMVPVRDGIRLNTSICRPKAPRDKLPFLLTRTPYGIAGDTVVGPDYQFLAADGYIFVWQDIRGRFGSEGEFLMNRPLHDPADSAGVDESTDTYDTVEWLLAHEPGHNGRAGALGVSYPGFLATMAGIRHHPAMKAVSPQAPMTDTWIGDDFFHQGAFRQSYGFEYSASLELSKDMSVPPPIGAWDTYDWYLELGSLAGVDARYFQGRNRTWSAFVNHPTYDGFWQARAVQRRLAAPEVPMLTVGGWWDQEDRWGPLATFAAVERGDSAHQSSLVMGPWNHGGWRRADERRMAVVDPGTAEAYRRDVEAPWFAYWLKDQGSLQVPNAYLYDTGARTWRSFDAWPPTDGQRRSLFLHAGGKLSFDRPAAGERPYDQYVSDPAHPVPYRARPIEQTYDPRGSHWRTWETEDQRFVDGRPDVVTWVSDKLSQDITIAGDVTARLVASTSGRDADWVVKLIDVFPDSVPDDWSKGGYQLMVAHEIMRGRYRTGFSRPAPLAPGTPLDFTVDLHQQAYTFRQGHKLMVQIQSTWFPLYDRNPQTWVPNIFKARPTDFVAQTHRIWHTPARPSRIELTTLSR